MFAYQRVVWLITWLTRLYWGYSHSIHGVKLNQLITKGAHCTKMIHILCIG